MGDYGWESVPEKLGSPSYSFLSPDIGRQQEYAAPPSTASYSYTLTKGNVFKLTERIKK